MRDIEFKSFIWEPMPFTLVWQWNCHNMFLQLKNFVFGILTPDIPHKINRLNIGLHMLFHLGEDNKRALTG